jgi:pimeloyl-ACP methyl ester carboxylesterase
MRIAVDGRDVYAYTGARALVPGQPTIVFVHGAANDHSVWSLQSRYFAHHGRNVLAVDLPAHGRTTGPVLSSVDALAVWLAAVTDAVGIERYAIVGHSMGALAALEHASRFEERVEKLALLGPAAPMAVSDDLLDAALRNDHVAYELINGWSHSHDKQIGGNRLPGVWMTGQAIRLMERTAPGVLHADLLACRDYQSGLEAAARVRAPALLVVGQRDLMTPARNASPLASALRDARTVTLPGTGHSMMTEQPDAVLDALREFL